MSSVNCSLRQAKAASAKKNGGKSDLFSLFFLFSPETQQKCKVQKPRQRISGEEVNSLRTSFFHFFDDVYTPNRARTIVFCPKIKLTAVLLSSFLRYNKRGGGEEQRMSRAIGIRR